MLLFKPQHVDPILLGTKTQTRRFWKKARAKAGSIHLAKQKMISREYFARLEILDVYKERLGSISEQDALSEGYSSSIAYLIAFANIACKCNPPIRNIDELRKLDIECEILSRDVFVVKFKVIP
jgi:hypothetical protein